MATGQRALAAWCVLLLQEDSPPLSMKKREESRRSCASAVSGKKKTHPRSLDRCVFQISLLFFQMMAATFGDRRAFFAERAFFRLVGRNSEVEQRIYLFLRYAEVCFAAASVY